MAASIDAVIPARLSAASWSPTTVARLSSGPDCLDACAHPRVGIDVGDEKRPRRVIARAAAD